MNVVDRGFTKVFQPPTPKQTDMVLRSLESEW